MYVQDKLKKEFNIVSHSWISYLYGAPKKYKLVGYLSFFFQYVFPNLLSTAILLVPIFTNDYGKYLFSFDFYKRLFTIDFNQLHTFTIIIFGCGVFFNIINYIVIVIFMRFYSSVKNGHINFYDSNLTWKRHFKQ